MAVAKRSEFWSSIAEIAVLFLFVFLIRTFFFGLYQVPSGSMEATMLVGERFFADKLTPYFSDINRREVIAFNDPTFAYSKNPIIRLFQDYVWGPSNWTKRVIGIPGDRVRGSIEDGKPVLYLNGQKLQEPYKNPYPLIKTWKVDPETVATCLQNGKAKRIWDLIVPKSFDPHVPLEKQPLYRIKKNRVVVEEAEPGILFPDTPIRAAVRKEYSDGETYWTGGDEFDVVLGKNQYWVMGDNRLGSKDSRVFGPIDRRLIHGKIKYRIWSIDSDEGWWVWDLIKNPIDFWSRVRWGRFFQKLS